MTPTAADLAALLRAIVTDPADTASRLVLADALEEGGQGERADFIRAQCRLAAEFPSGETPCEFDANLNHGFGRWRPRCRCRACALRRAEHKAARRHLGVEWEAELRRPLIEERVAKALAGGARLASGAPVVVFRWRGGASSPR